MAHRVDVDEERFVEVFGQDRDYRNPLGEVAYLDAATGATSLAENSIVRAAVGRAHGDSSGSVRDARWRARKAASTASSSWDRG